MKTNQKPSGGPAYPQHVAPQYAARPDLHGMSLRDYFAASALPLAFQLVKSDLKDIEDDDAWHERLGWLAAEAYQIADAMIAERS